MGQKVGLPFPYTRSIQEVCPTAGRFTVFLLPISNYTTKSDLDAS